MPAILRAATSTAPSTRPTVTAMIGGSAANPTYPVTANVLLGGVSAVFVPDHAARFFYFVDGSGNLLRWDSTTPSTAPVQILAHATIGATIACMDITPDDSAIYAATNAYTVVKILTASPYTVSLLAGSGSTGHAEGTGAAAAFGVVTGIAVDQAAGAFVIIGDSTQLALSKIQTSTGALTFLGSQTGHTYAYSNPISIDLLGNIVLCTGASIGVISAVSGTLIYNFSTPGNYGSPSCADSASPSAANIYFFNQNTNSSLSRYNIATAAVVNVIATIPSYANQVSMFFRSPAVYLVNAAGELLQIKD